MDSALAAPARGGLKPALYITSRAG